MSRYDSLCRSAQIVREPYVGMRPSLLAEYRLVNLQAYMDESFDDEIFVLAGYVSTVGKWEAFSKEWEELLPLAPINKRGVREFKMSHMMSVSERRSDIQAFYNVIKQHTEAGMFAKIQMNIFNEVKSWFFLDIKKPSHVAAWENPYFVAWRMLFDEIHDHRNDNGLMPIFFEQNEAVDFVFDQRAEEGRVRAEFDFIYNNAPEDFKSFYGKIPKFEESHVYLPLQAADMLAWYARDRRLGPDLSQTFCEWEDSPSTLPLIAVTLNHRYYLSLLLQVYRQHVPKGEKFICNSPVQFQSTVQNVLALPHMRA